MKILLVTEFFPSDGSLKFTGGVEARTYYLAKNLAKKHKVSVICRKTASFTDMRTPEVCVYPVGLMTRRVEASLFSLWGRIIFIFSAFIKGLSLDFDLVEGSNFIVYLPAFFLGMIKKKPAVAWYADVFKDKWLKIFGLTGIFGEIVERVSLKLPWAKIIALSGTTKEKLIKAGINKQKIQVIYGGVDLNKFKIPSTLLGRQNSKFKIKNIICISRLVKYKRVNDLIIAFSQLVKKHPDLNLVIVGQGPEENKLKKSVNIKRLTKKVLFYKNLTRNKLVQLLRQSYILCLPSVIEGFGLATIEAAACQTPYVISDIKVNKEITKNGQGGLIFQKRNVEDLRKKLDLLLKNKKLYKEKQKQGLILTGNYDWRKITKQTEKVYTGAINE